MERGGEERDYIDKGGREAEGEVERTSEQEATEQASE